MAEEESEQQRERGGRENSGASQGMNGYMEKNEIKANVD